MDIPIPSKKTRITAESSPATLIGQAVRGNLKAFMSVRQQLHIKMIDGSRDVQSSKFENASFSRNFYRLHHPWSTHIFDAQNYALMDDHRT